ncbi:MAG: hydrolase [Pseudomonadota bacterium]
MIRSAFKPAWWLASPHLQTIWPALIRRVGPPARRRERIETADNDFIEVDWSGSGRSPIVILIHGLSGSSNSGYIKGLQHALLNRGFRSVAMNFRGCSGIPNRRARSYHSGDTEDLDALYRLLRQREPNTPIAAVGYSLGGNVLLKWLGERRGELKLFATVAVSVPMLLSACATRMDTGFSRIYRNTLLSELKQYLKVKHRHLEQLDLSEEAEKLKNLGNLRDTRSFWEYDDRVIAKLYPFKDVHDYYQQASSRQFLRHIRVPTLIIHAVDDPFMTPQVIPAREELSSFTSLELCNGGGHVGFITGMTPGRPMYWLESRIPDFLVERRHAHARAQASSDRQITGSL